MKLTGRFMVLCLMTCFIRAAHAEPIRIMAASSLTEAISDVAQDHDATLSVGSSGRISTQVLAGAPADIVALAHPEWMKQLIEARLIDRHTTLAGNQLVVATDHNQAETIRSLTDLARVERIGIASESSPAGQYAREALRSVGLLSQIQPQLVNGSNVRSVIGHLETGAVDAAFVYRTDLAIAPTLEARFVVDPGLHTPIRIPVALTVSGSEKPAAVKLFERIESKEGQALFIRQGFSAPPPEDTATHLRSTPQTKLDWAPVGLSMWVGTMSVLLSILPALALGWLMARREFRGKAVVSTLCLAPLVLPPVVTGWLLLQLLMFLGIPLAFTRWAAVMAAAVVGFPLLLILTRQAIESVDIRYPQLAETLGLTPLQAFKRVTLPMALPGIIAGCVLAFSRALGEFGATAMIAGDQPGETRTLALAVYALAEQPGGNGPAGQLVLISMGLTLGGLYMYERLVWRQRRLTGEAR